MKTVFQFLFRCVFLTAIIWVLVGCSNKPSHSLVSSTIDQFAGAESHPEIFEIRNAKKKNGYILDDFYHLEISYERYFLVGIDDAISIMSQRVAAEEPDNIMEGIARGVFGLATGTGLLKISLEDEYGKFQAGDTIQELTTLRFIKTDNGWQLYEDLK